MITMKFFLSIYLNSNGFTGFLIDCLINLAESALAKQFFEHIVFLVFLSIFKLNKFNLALL